MTLTREAAAVKAAELLGTPVTAHSHGELEGDQLCGGFAFDGGDRAAIIGYRGGYQTSMIAESGETLETLIIGSHTDRYPDSVCADCQSRASDSDGRRIVGYNEGFSGGLIVFYAESPSGPQSEIAGEVLDTGRCWIDGIECSIGEARFGGVVIQRLNPA
ncbi:hypothetical protein [Aeromicrobium sp. P5_D10]